LTNRRNHLRLCFFHPNPASASSHNNTNQSSDRTAWIIGATGAELGSGGSVAAEPTAQRRRSEAKGQKRIQQGAHHKGATKPPKAAKPASPT
ncbi:hypothetical protein OEZ74_26100, partial [Leclercia adecarboxylata]|uniref:hypothetical protein n=1 Tax=Leclercia adecarboxylata TaxID=83655 RepID=UPI00234DCE7A